MTGYVRGADSFSFRIIFHTPLLIGGSTSMSADPLGVTGKALRGVWRFWFRALLGGMGVSLKECFKNESDIFGSTEKSCFRLKIQNITPLKARKIPRLPHKSGYESASKEGFLPDTEFEVKVQYHSNWSPQNQKLLKATICLWGCLGAIGNRGQHGFGSPIVQDINEVLGFTKLNLQDETTLYNSAKELLEEIRKKVSDSLKFSASWNKDYCGYPAADFFQLRSLNQVFISKLFEEELISKDAVAGTNIDNEGIITQVHRSPFLGFEKEKIQSPCYTKLFQLKNKKYVAFCTLCPINGYHRIFYLDYGEYKADLISGKVSKKMKDALSRRNVDENTPIVEADKDIIWKISQNDTTHILWKSLIRYPDGTSCEILVVYPDVESWVVRSLSGKKLV